MFKAWFVVITTRQLRVYPSHCCLRLTREMPCSRHALADRGPKVRVQGPLFHRHHNTGAFFKSFFGRSNGFSLRCKRSPISVHVFKTLLHERLPEQLLDGNSVSDSPGAHFTNPAPDLGVTFVQRNET